MKGFQLKPLKGKKRKWSSTDSYGPAEKPPEIIEKDTGTGGWGVAARHFGGLQTNLPVVIPMAKG